MLSNRQTHRHDTQTDPTTVTLATHARRGLIIGSQTVIRAFIFVRPKINNCA